MYHACDVARHLSVTVLSDTMISRDITGLCNVVVSHDIVMGHYDIMLHHDVMCCNAARHRNVTMSQQLGVTVLHDIMILCDVTVTKRRVTL